MSKFQYRKVSVIGAGRVGTAISLALYKKGYPFVSIIDSTSVAAIALAKSVKCRKASIYINDLSIDTEILLIAVPDISIAMVSKEVSKIKRLKFKKLFAFHTSGVHSSEILKSLKSKGATIASIHPIQTFPPGRKPSQLYSSLRGIYYGIEGNGKSIREAVQVVTAVNGKVVIIPKELKPLYHAVCVFASGCMMIFLNALSELSKKLPLRVPWTSVFGPLMTTSMENAMSQSTTEALTGPIVRKDFTTVEMHLKALEKHAPQFLPIYIIAGIETARALKEHNQLEQKEFEILLQLFKKSVRYL